MKPTNQLVNPMLTDFYQITMAYAYWKAGVHEEKAVFDLFFRKNPFHGEFAIYAGLEEILRLCEHFHFSEEHVAYLKEQMPECDPGFFDWLRGVDCSRMRIYAMKEGTVAFPLVPLMRVEGPIAIAQLLETPVLTLTNYPSLMTTNAAKYRLIVGFDKGLIEFGLRRAQGPDGGISASRYSFLGGLFCSPPTEEDQPTAGRIDSTPSGLRLIHFPGTASPPLVFPSRKAIMNPCSGGLWHFSSV